MRASWTTARSCNLSAARPCCPSAPPVPEGERRSPGIRGRGTAGRDSRSRPGSTAPWAREPPPSLAPALPLPWKAMSSTHARRPRFERAPVRRMVLTSRDIELLRAVHRHRFLRSTHLVALADGSRQAVLRRLQLLFHHGYVERPVFQLDWYTGGSQPLVYALGKRGAKAIAAAGWRSGVCLDSKNRSLSRVFLHHTLAVADVMVAFEVACRERPDLDFIRAE